LKSTVLVVNAKLSAALRTSNLRFGFRHFALFENVMYETVHAQTGALTQWLIKKCERESGVRLVEIFLR